MFQNEKLKPGYSLSSPHQHQEHTASLLVLTLRLPKITLGLRAQRVGTREVGRGMAGSAGAIYLGLGIPFSGYRFWKIQIKIRSMGPRISTQVVG